MEEVRRMSFPMTRKTASELGHDAFCGKRIIECISAMIEGLSMMSNNQQSVIGSGREFFLHNCKFAMIWAKC